MILDSNGKKFGKSEGNAIFLDTKKNSPYFIYQYFLNCNDADIERFLKIFTFYTFDEIKAIVDEHQQSPALRYGQKKLASYVVELIAGKEAAQQAQTISDFLFGKNNKIAILQQLSNTELEALAKEVGSLTLSTPEARVLDLLVNVGLAPSNGEAKKLIASGAISINEQLIEDINHTVSDANTINNYLLIRKGKKTYKLISFE